MNEKVACQICSSESTGQLNSRGRFLNVCCPTCGRYGITDQAGWVLDTLHAAEKAKVSACLREQNIRGNDPVVLFSEHHPDRRADYPIWTVQEIISSFPATVSDRLDRALINLHRLSKIPGERGQLVIKHDYPVVFAETPNTMAFFLSELQESGLVQCDTATTVIYFRLTARGWNRIAELERAIPTKDSKQGFVAMWFEQSLDRAYKEGFAKAIKDTGHDPIRVDFVEHNEKICDRIIAEIRKSRFLVADMTGTRSGVFFEAGYALGIGIPVIWTCRETHKATLSEHFDTRQYNHILWTDETNLYQQLKYRIEATIMSGKS